MAYKIQISKEERKKIWNIIRSIIKEHYDVIKEEKSLRDSFYTVRDYLAKDYLQIGKITSKMFDFFGNDEDSYKYYTQDLWFQLEKEGYERPEAKAIGTFYWKDGEYTIDKIGYWLGQCRGFIYVEKDGVAEKLKKLSNYGWGIVAAQGQATREIRRLIK